MSCIASAFAHGKAFIPFITAGDPTLDVTERLVYAMAEEGASLIELGVPFSDPMAEGPVIQDANIRALRHHVTTDDVFALVKRVRARGCNVPLVIMTYANVVYSYGIDRFAARQAELGMGGVILPDVPFEERAEFAGTFSAHGLDLVPLVAPTSASRVAQIAREATGFVYIVSSLGVTGERAQIGTDASIVQQVKEANPDIPAAVGFGISTPEQAADMARVSDGAIVGSSIVRMIGEHGEDCVEPVRAYVRSLVAAVRSA